MSISALTVYLIATRTFCTVHARKGYKTTLRLETCLNLKYTHFWHSNEIFIKSLPCTETSPGKLSSSRATFAILFVVLSSCALTFVKIRELGRAENKLVGNASGVTLEKITTEMAKEVEEARSRSSQGQSTKGASICRASRVSLAERERTREEAVIL